MNRIVSISVAGLGALVPMSTAGSQSAANTQAVATTTAQSTPLARVTSQPKLTVVTTNDGHSVSAHCVTIQSSGTCTSSNACSGSGVVVRAASPQAHVSTVRSTNGPIQVLAIDDRTPGLTVIRSNGSVSAGTCTSSSASSGQGACAGSGVGLSAQGGAAAIASTGSGQSLDLRELLNKAGVAHGQAIVVESDDVHAMQPRLAAPGKPSIFDRVLADKLGSDDEADEPDEVDEPDEMGADDVDMEVGDEGIQGFVFPEEGQLKASIEDALTSARDSIAIQQQDLEVILERSREAMRRAQESARQAMDESRVRFREAQDAAREGAQRRDEAAREARSHALRYHEAGPGAAADGVDRALEARIEALEQAARERGQSIDSSDRSLEERVAQLERAMNSRNSVRARVLEVAPNSDVDVIEVHPDGAAGSARRSIRSRAGASAPSAGGTARTHVWVAPSATAPFDRVAPVNPSTLTPFESMSPPAPVAPVAPVAPPVPSAPDAMAPRAGRLFSAPPTVTPAPAAPRGARGFRGTARASAPNAQERAELERALDELRSEAGRLREQMERMRAEIDRLPQQDR